VPASRDKQGKELMSVSDWAIYTKVGKTTAPAQKITEEKKYKHREEQPHQKRDIKKDRKIRNK